MVQTTGITQPRAEQRNAEQYEQLIGNGTFVPNRFPLNTVPIVILFAFLLLPKKYSGPVVRVSTAIAISSVSLAKLFYTRSKEPSMGAILGMLNGYLVLWSIAHLVDADPKTEYARIIRVDADTENRPITRSKSSSKPIHASEKAGTDGKLKQATAASYRWQAFPDTISERFDWSLDLFTSFDGMGWSWAVASLDAPPARVQESLKLDDGGAYYNDKLTNKKWLNGPQKQEGLTASTLLRTTIQQLLLGYVIVDILKTMVSVDPWFYGQFDAPNPPYVPDILSHPIIVRAVRLLVGIGCLQYVIYNAMLLRTLVYMALQKFQDIGARGEVWMYHSLFGSLNAVLKLGLAGFWSHYWHQVFRCVFTAPSRLIIRHLNIPPRSGTAQALRILVAFFCSGMLHASMSFALIGPSDPMVPLLFFMSQPIGIAIQYLVPFLVAKTPIDSKVPKWVRQACNFLWALTFLYVSGYPLAKDLARGNAFVFEPVPISPLRGMFGCKEDGYYCWRGQWIRWVEDGWRSGIAA